MKGLADVCLVPLGTDISLTPYVAACERVLEEAGLHPVLHACALPPLNLPRTVWGSLPILSY